MRHIFDFAKHERRSVVHEQVDISVCSHGFRDRSLYRSGIGSVGSDVDGSPASLFYQLNGLSARVFLQLGHRHACAFGRESPGNRP